ncbi:hypothetical protein [Microvirga sp. TS319]|uniref:hypothetical protein n=1 Tax=Microvirga sp. TS319 TaxID=3241165 RepID=UPI00351A3C06
MDVKRHVSELRQAKALDIFCEDCGSARRFQRRHLLELDMGGFTSFQQLAAKLVCRHCRERKGQGHNVTLRPRWFSHPRMTVRH